MALAKLQKISVVDDVLMASELEAILGKEYEKSLLSNLDGGPQPL